VFVGQQQLQRRQFIIGVFDRLLLGRLKLLDNRLPLCFRWCGRWLRWRLLAAIC